MVSGCFLVKNRRAYARVVPNPQDSDFAPTFDFDHKP